MKCSNVVLYNRNVVSVFVYTLSASLHFAIPTSVRFLLEIFHVNFGEYFDANKLQHAGVVAWTCIIYEVNHAWIFPGIIILSLY